MSEFLEFAVSASNVLMIFVDFTAFHDTISKDIIVYNTISK